MICLDFNHWQDGFEAFSDTELKKAFELVMPADILGDRETIACIMRMYGYTPKKVKGILGKKRHAYSHGVKVFSGIGTPEVRIVKL